MTSLEPSSGTLLDACSVLSLYATRHMAAIVAITPGPVFVADLVVAEALCVRRVVEGVSEPEPVNLAPLIDAGVLIATSARDDDELQTFVDLAVDLDDGEAMPAALAIHRSHVFVTDDGKAERLLAGRVRLRSTLDLVRDWAEAERIDDATLRAAFTGIYERGYQPPHRHALQGWWDTIMAGTAHRA